MFAHENISKSPFKTMDLMAAVGPVYPANLVRTLTITTGCPAFDSLCEATTEEDFRALKGEGNHILKGRPVHIWAHPSIWIAADCSRQAKASGLALLMINEIRRMEGTVPPPSAQELQELQEQKKGLHVVLAFLWAVSQKLPRAVGPLERHTGK
jgi:hypothetical protein